MFADFELQAIEQQRRTDARQLQRSREASRTALLSKTQGRPEPRTNLVAQLRRRLLARPA